MRVLKIIAAATIGALSLSATSALANGNYYDRAYAAYATMAAAPSYAPQVIGYGTPYQMPQPYAAAYGQQPAMMQYPYAQAQWSYAPAEPAPAYPAYQSSTFPAQAAYAPSYPNHGYASYAAVRASYGEWQQRPQPSQDPRNYQHIGDITNILPAEQATQPNIRSTRYSQGVPQILPAPLIPGAGLPQAPARIAYPSAPAYPTASAPYSAAPTMNYAPAFAPAARQAAPLPWGLGIL